MIRRFSVLISLLLLVQLSSAQIVNVESKRGNRTQEGLHGNVRLNFNLTRNTTDIISYGAQNNVQYLKNRHRLLLLTDLSRVRAADADFINNGYEHIRYNLEFGKKRHFAFEAFQQAQFNSVQKIRYRQLAGAGLRWNVVERDSLKLWLGSLPMYEYEELTTDVIERNFRQSSYLLLFFVLPSGLEFQTINYYQPKLDDWSDYRISHSSTLEFGLLEWLRFNVSFNLLYDSKPPVDIPDLIFTLKNGLTVEF